jgi:hypothetical protein
VIHGQRLYRWFVCHAKTARLLSQNQGTKLDGVKVTIQPEQEPEQLKEWGFFGLALRFRG